MRTYKLKKYPEALAYKLHKNWTYDGTIKRCDAIYTQGKIKIFYPEFNTWHRYLKMLPTKKAFMGLFINHGKIWIPHISLSAKLNMAELKTFQTIANLNQDAAPDEQIGKIYDTYCDRLPKSRQQALWLNLNDIELLDTIGLFKGKTWKAWQAVLDNMKCAENYYQTNPWTQTKMGLNLMHNVNFTTQAADVFAIEADYLSASPYMNLERITLEYDLEKNIFKANNVPHTNHISHTLAEVHVEKNYPKGKLNLFNGLAG